MFYLVLLLLLWFGSGFVSYVFWESKMNDITLSSLFFGFALSIIGPFVFPLGWGLYKWKEGSNYKPIIVMKKTPSISVDIDENL